MFASYSRAFLRPPSRVRTRTLGSPRDAFTEASHLVHRLGVRVSMFKGLPLEDRLVPGKPGKVVKDG